MIVRLAPFASNAPDGAEHPGAQLTVWFAAQLSVQLELVRLVVPLLHEYVAEPVVGCVLSVDVAVAPWLMFNTDGAVQVLPDTAHVVPAVTVHGHPVAMPERAESALTLPAAVESVPLNEPGVEERGRTSMKHVALCART